MTMEQLIQEIKLFYMNNEILEGNCYNSIQAIEEIAVKASKGDLIAGVSLGVLCRIAERRLDDFGLQMPSDAEVREAIENFPMTKGFVIPVAIREDVPEYCAREVNIYIGHGFKTTVVR